MTRRVAEAGYTAVAVDLLSGRAEPAERRQDIQSALMMIRDQTYVQGDRLGAIGFCAGGGNVFDLAVNSELLAAALSSTARLRRLTRSQICERPFSAFTRGTRSRFNGAGSGSAHPVE